MNDNSKLRQRENKQEGLNGRIPNGQEHQTDEETNIQRRGKISRKIEQIHDRCVTCCIPCLSRHNPLPENPTWVDKFKHAFMLPLHGNVATYIQFTVVCLQLWIVIYTLTHGEALPGGNLFSLLILFICCAIGGYFISLIRLPPLLGMLIVGVMLRNIPGLDSIGENIDTKWSGALRKIALTVILTRAGLGLDIVKLRKLSWAVLRLAFLPCAAEAVTVGIVSHFVLGFPWKWSLMLGCILGALSPAVTVPSLVSLQDRHYGVAKGIPTMLLAAGGLDNVLCVTGFSVFMGIIFSEGDLAVTIIKGPLGVFVGIVYGFVAGFFLWYIPSTDCANKIFYRSLLLLGFGIIAIFGSSEIQLSGAGPLGCLTTATVAGYKWRQRRLPGDPDEVSGVMAIIWLIAQHFLFGLIGAAVNISKIESSTAGLGILTLAIGLVVRSAVDFVVTIRTGFNLKERIFITLTWLSKATVQAAIGGLALDKVRESGHTDESLKYATDILTLSVLAIVICAPTGATLMAILGPKFLVKGYTTEADKTDNEKGHIDIIDMTTMNIQVEETKEKPKETKEIIVELDQQSKVMVQKINVADVPIHEMEKIPESSENISDKIDETYNSEVQIPEVYKSQLTVTLSNSQSDDIESIVKISNDSTSEEQSTEENNPALTTGAENSTFSTTVDNQALPTGVENPAFVNDDVESISNHNINKNQDTSKSDVNL